MKARVRYCFNQVSMKNGGLILWNAIALCGMFNTSCHMEKHIVNGDLENHFMACHSDWRNSSIQSYFYDRPVKVPTIWWESFTWNILRTCIFFEKNLERRYFGCRHRAAGNFRHIRNPCSNALNGEHFVFLIADATAKLSGRDHGVRESTSTLEQIAGS